jgi:UDP-glucose 4-epimerase
MNEDTPRALLVTGAYGRIGTAFYEECQGQYRFRLTDRDPAILDRPLAEGDTASLLDITDPAQCAEACAGIDTVLHLAADPSPEADFDGSLLENNIRGTYNVFRAAAVAGCRRVIFASSVHAVLGYSPDSPVPEAAPIWPVNMYGVSKCFGEATARKFASADGLSCIAIRIGAYEAAWMLSQESAAERPWLSAYVSPRDLNQLIRRCIDVEGVVFAIVHGVSDNRLKRLAIDETRRLVGYEPLDDGYEQFDMQK